MICPVCKQEVAIRDAAGLRYIEAHKREVARNDKPRRVRCAGSFRNLTHVAR